jgi:hypothetical protein
MLVNCYQIYVDGSGGGGGDYDDDGYNSVSSMIQSCDQLHTSPEC